MHRSLTLRQGNCAYNPFIDNSAPVAKDSAATLDVRARRFVHLEGLARYLNFPTWKVRHWLAGGAQARDLA